MFFWSVAVFALGCKQRLKSLRGDSGLRSRTTRVTTSDLRGSGLELTGLIVSLNPMTDWDSEDSYLDASYLFQSEGLFAKVRSLSMSTSRLAECPSLYASRYGFIFAMVSLESLSKS